MSAPFPNLFKSAAPAPRVVLLPDALFFVRVIPVAPGTPPSEVAAQIALALEALAPFPLTQLYYGFFHPEGAPEALLYAAYRKRFTAEQTAAWGQADLVMPAFVALLGGEIQPATTLLLAGADILTALHFKAGPVPATVLTRSFPSEAPAEERTRGRDELLRAAGESLHAVDLSAAPEAVAAEDDGGLVFRSGDFTSRLPAALVGQLDVRDKDELALRGRGRARDMVLWRIVLGCAALLALCLLSEFALIGGRLWQKSRLAVVAAQSPAVETIENAKTLADRIGELSTKRLMPFEMIALASAHKPASVQFIRATASGLDRLEIEAQTGNPVDVGSYQTALNGLPACASVEVSDQRTRDGVSTFTLVLTFKPEALKPGRTTS